MKALDLTRQWCHLDNINAIQNEEERNEALKCDCHDTDDGYAWESDPKTPLRMGDSFNIDAHFYYNQLNAISFSSLAKTIQSGAALLPEADVVLVGVGNLDIKEIRISPNHFIKAFHELLLNFRKTYPKQTLIVRAPQYFCCGTLWGTSWNTGRSYAFYQIMKEMVDSFDNVLLWNTFSIGNEDSFCHAEGSSLSRRNVVNVENQLLWHLLC